MSFMDIYGYSDVVQSQDFEFEGYATHELGYDYSIDNLNQMNQTVLEILRLPMNDPVDSRTLYISKQLRLALDGMRNFADAQIDDSIQAPKVKFLSYSAHDWTVAQMLLFFFNEEWLEQVEKFEVLPYASSFKLELHSTSECESEECFWVEVMYNGKVLSFDDDCENEKRCTYPEFIQLLNARGFIHTDTHYEVECAKSYKDDTEKFVTTINDSIV